MRSRRLGSKVRALRSERELTQKAMAVELGISPSYLNLIEHNNRPLPAELLFKMAAKYGIDLGEFAREDDDRLHDDLMEAARTSEFEDDGLSEQALHRLVRDQPGLGRAVLKLFRSHHSARQSVATLAERIAGPTEVVEGFGRGLLPTEEVSDLVQVHRNHFPALEAAAEALWASGVLDANNLFAGLVEHLRMRHAVTLEVLPVGAEGTDTLRRFDPKRRVLTLSRALRPRTLNFQLAVQIALLEHRAVIAEIVDAGGLGSADARNLATLALARYFAAAVIMPYQPFLAAAAAHRYDIEMLGHRFRASFEQVCHRLTTLRREGAEGVPFHFVRVDIAGNIIKQHSGSGIRFPRFGAGCSLWNVYRCFQAPGRIRIQVSRMPNGERFFCLATTIRKGIGGYKDEHTVHAIGLGTNMEHARKLVYSDGVALDVPAADVRIGVTCRLCEREGCAQRAFPAISVPLRVSLDERGLSPFDAPRR